MALVVCCEINRKYCFFIPGCQNFWFCKWNAHFIYRRRSTWLFFCGKETLCQWKSNFSFWNVLLICSDSFVIWSSLVLSPPLSPHSPTGVYRFCHLIFATISHEGLPQFPTSTEELMIQGEWKLKLTLLDDIKEVDGWGHVGKAGTHTVQAWTYPLMKCCLSALCIHPFPLLLTKMP